MAWRVLSESHMGILEIRATCKVNLIAEKFFFYRREACMVLRKWLKSTWNTKRAPPEKFQMLNELPFVVGRESYVSSVVARWCFSLSSEELLRELISLNISSTTAPKDICSCIVTSADRNVIERCTALHLRTYIVVIRGRPVAVTLTRYYIVWESCLGAPLIGRESCFVTPRVKINT